jgi:hypothetical protein
MVDLMLRPGSERPEPSARRCRGGFPTQRPVSHSWSGNFRASGPQQPLASEHGLLVRHPAARGRTASGASVSYLQVDLDSRENEARVALAAFYNALNYVRTYFGWPAEVIDDLNSRIEAKVPTFFL